MTLSVEALSGIVWAWMTLSVEALSGLAMDTPRYGWNTIPGIGGPKVTCEGIGDLNGEVT